MRTMERRINDAAMRLFAERGTPDVPVSDVAAAAGIARGTLYRNVGSISELYDQVRAQVAAELHQRNVDVMDAAGITDPPHRLATGTRLIVRIAHEDPSMAKFLVRFAMSDESFRELVSGPPMQDINAGIATGRYSTQPGEEVSIASMLLGTVVSAMWLVLEGHQGWRQAGTGAAQLALRALGVSPEEASELAQTPLP